MACLFRLGAEKYLKVKEVKKLGVGAYNNSYWVPDSSPLSQPATLGRTFFQVRRGVIPRTSSCLHVSKPLDQVSISISETQQVYYRRIWAPDSLCHVSTVTLLSDSSSMKHLRNSNLNRKPIWDQLKKFQTVKMSWQNEPPTGFFFYGHASTCLLCFKYFHLCHVIVMYLTWRVFIRLQNEPPTWH